MPADPAILKLLAAIGAAVGAVVFGAVGAVLLGVGLRLLFPLPPDWPRARQPRWWRRDDA